MTSLTREQADAARLLGLVRGHWSIENNLHGERDGAFGCEPAKGDLSRICAPTTTVTALAWSPDGGLVGVGTQDGLVRLWHRDGTLVRQFTGFGAEWCGDFGGCWTNFRAALSIRAAFGSWWGRRESADARGPA